MLPLQCCRTWSEIPWASRQWEQHEHVKASKCNWENTQPCQSVRLAEKPVYIVMKRSQKINQIVYFVSSGLLVLFKCNFTTRVKAVRERKTDTHNNPLRLQFLNPTAAAFPGILLSSVPIRANVWLHPDCKCLRCGVFYVTLCKKKKKNHINQKT